MEVKITDPRLLEWGIPRYQTAGSAAIDLFACVDGPLVLDPQTPAVLISSGIALSFGDFGLAGLVMPRSGAGHKRGLVMGNTVGLIDPDYTGEIFMSAWNRGTAPIVIEPGERIAQLLFVPVVRPAFTVVDAFSGTTDRAAGGFGSTGA